MPKAMESALRRGTCSKYEGDRQDRCVYGIMNKVGVMRGSKITAKGKKMERGRAQHAALRDMGGM